jgi:uncharacterized protein
MKDKTTLVIGASLKPWRYSHKAVNALRHYGYRVVAIGLRKGFIGDIPVLRDLPEAVDIDTVTLYIGAERQLDYYDYLTKLKPRRVIFNPGAENRELEEKLSEIGVETLEECTLVMLSSGKY